MEHNTPAHSQPNEHRSAAQYEDGALKTTMQFFANELLPLFGIKGKVVSFAPTELVKLDLQKLFQDFNLVMDDGSWKHFEFQSTNEGIPGLKRFRSYESLTSYQHKVPVTTYVLYSGTIQNPVTEFTEGVNTYRVVPIIMKNFAIQKLIDTLQHKIESGIPITKEDLVQLALCPLMGGEMPQKERIQTAFRIVRNAVDISSEEIKKIEAVIYSMAEKFLDYLDMEEVKEEISMTRIGQMLVNEGIEKGIEQGIEKGIAEGEERAKLELARNLMDLLDEHVIAERTGLPLETVHKMKEEYLASQAK